MSIISATIAPHNGEATQPVDTPAAETLLLPHHLAELRASGLGDEIIAAAGIYSETDPHEVAALLHWKHAKSSIAPALILPYPSASSGVSYARAKLDKPRNVKDKVVKYEAPKGEPPRLYYLPTRIDALQDISQAIVITEGEKKALALEQAGYFAIGIAGVDAWQSKGRPIADLDRVEWRGRTVHFAFDSDATTNPRVQRAETQFTAELTKRGADVWIARIPSAAAENGGAAAKVGVDDYLLATGADAFAALLAGATQPEVADTERPVANRLPPENVAQEIVERSRIDGVPTIASHNGQYYVWVPPAYRPVDDRRIDRLILQHLRGVSTHIKTADLANVRMHLRSIVTLPDDLEEPSWLSTT